MELKRFPVATTHRNIELTITIGKHFDFPDYYAAQNFLRVDTENCDPVPSKVLITAYPRPQQDTFDIFLEFA